MSIIDRGVRSAAARIAEKAAEIRKYSEEPGADPEKLISQCEDLSDQVQKIGQRIFVNTLCEDLRRKHVHDPVPGFRISDIERIVNSTD
jgi:hypothetical protein